MSDLKAETKLAIELEKKGYEFYAQSAKKTKNQLAASVLASLAERENLHIERITEFYQNLTGEKQLPGDWLSRVEVAPSRADLLKPILMRLKNELDRKAEANGDVNAVYSVAEGLERDSYTLYEKLAAENSDKLPNKFYSALAQEEREHYSILDETLLYLNDPGEWYRLKERWIVEG